MSSEDFRKAYPEALEKAERKLLACSPKWSKRCDPEATHEERAKSVDPAGLVGVGLSGGGIRSATFALGVFQGLAKLRLLDRIDYLSTVSGGGYFGSFFGSLFSRDYVKGIDDVNDILTLPGQSRPVAGASSSGDEIKSRVFPWLRENGRYLSPNGAGDLLVGGAVMFRNWVAMQVVLVTLILFCFLLAQLVRAWLEVNTGTPVFWYWFYVNGFHWNLPFDLNLWGSPWALLAIAMFLLWVLPFGWAYWMVRGGERQVLKVSTHPVIGLLATVALSLWAIAAWWPDPERSRRLLLALAIAVVLAVAAVFTLVAWAASAGWAGRKWRQWEARMTAGEAPAEGESDPRERYLFKNNWKRHWLSVQLKGAMMASAAVFLFALIDSFGQTIYALIRQGGSIYAWLAGLLGALVGLTAGARKLAVMLGGKSGDKRPPGWSTALANVAALVLIFCVLSVINAGSHTVAWRGDHPLNAPPDLGGAAPRALTEVSALAVARQDDGWRVEEMKAEAPPQRAAIRADRHVRTVLVAALGMFVFSFLFGHSWPFLNRSTQLPLYSARLIRAYLGASNPWRHKGGNQPVTQVIPDDDLPMDQYWPTLKSSTGSPCQRGAPLHLINVTVNETIDGRSQVEQRDRKGMGMAVGPGGLSAGVRHHVVFDVEAEEGEQFENVEVFPLGGYRMFRYDPDPATGKTRFAGERLSLGMWLGISGAAFSTGIGARTSLGLSLLTGFANVRLGYWWYAGENYLERLSKLRLLFRGLFPVQNYILDEFTARFPGSARRHWYLSDGGHFENMGGYELIRRRLPFIIIVDAEADPDYTFAGLSGLVRKARLDYAAEIEFLEGAELGKILDPELLPYFGTLSMLRRGKWVEERRPNLADRKRTFDAADPIDRSRMSLAHAGLARVYYDGDRTAPGSWLLYLKPTMRGDEPLDVLQYHGENPNFPQETTIDQFFDEAQWESYRRLGMHIAEVVFGPSSTAAAGWRPGTMAPPSPAPLAGAGGGATSTPAGLAMTGSGGTGGPIAPGGVSPP